MNFDLSFYFAVFLRRIHYFIIITALVSATAIAAAFLLPSVYQATSLLVLESSTIPGALAAPTVQAAALEKLQLIENKLMTRQNLIDIANRLNVFKDIKKMTPDEVVKAMRQATTIKKSANKGEATIMNLTFSADTGRIAAAVVNEYVTQILKEDVDQRTKSAEATVDFFEQEVKRLSAELDQLSAKILDFQNKNSDALPSTLAFRLSQQTTLQGKLDTAEQNIRQLQDQRERLKALYESTGQVGNAVAPQTPEAKQLAALNDQLRQTLAVLAPDHPKVKLLQVQIAQLEEIVKNQTAPPADAANPTATMFDVQLADIDSKIALETQNRDQIAEQMTALQETIDRTPANQIALDALNRDYSNIQQQYNAAVGNLSKASAGERIEILSKGEKLSVLDAATVPNRPAKPNRPLIAVGGMAMGMFLGLGTIFLTELLNRAVRRPKDIVSAFGITPLVTIPYMRTPAETLQRRSMFIGMMFMAVVGIPAMIYAVHVFYQPLDILLDRVARQFGIRL
ncbi:GNVR domain-containing protein [Frigidibacter sp. SD6-1]|uniref:GumC family protein n=1 Tax=Frigidibacter sp. SD6-1 TaxID=3032581 RepID=UPI0024DFD8A3|nr:GNVR domain-containing protein [Frigidibacter sp. SD6-1]